MQKKYKDQLSLDAQLKFAKTINTVPKLVSHAVNKIVLKHLKKYTTLFQDTLVNDPDASCQRAQQISTLPETLLLCSERLNKQVLDKFQQNYKKYAKTAMKVFAPDVDALAKPTVAHDQILTSKDEGFVRSQKCAKALKGEEADSENFQQIIASLINYEPTTSFYTNLKPYLQDTSTSLLQTFTVKYVKDLVATVGLLPTYYLVQTFNEIDPIEKSKFLNDFQQGAAKQTTTDSNKCLAKILPCMTPEQQASLEKWFKDSSLLLVQILFAALTADIQTWVNLLVLELEKLLKSNDTVTPNIETKTRQELLDANLTENGARHTVVQNLLDTGLFNANDLEQGVKKKNNCFHFFVCGSKQKAVKSTVVNEDNMVAAPEHKAAI